MSNKKIEYEKALGVLENSSGKDYYTVEYQDALVIAMNVLREKINPTAHWIYSGNADDYSGYYINCSKCGTQRRAYDQDGDLDIPVACPHCGVDINIDAWEVQDHVRERNPDKFNKLFRVGIIYNSCNDTRKYTITAYAKNDVDAKDKAVAYVLINWIHDVDAENKVSVEFVETVNQ